MNKILLYIFTLVTLLNATIEPIVDMAKDIDYYELDNGLQVYLLTNENITNTNISMSVNVGWNIENNENFGLSHLVEHMVFRDKRVPHRDYLDYFNDEGAMYVNGFTSRYKTEFITNIDSSKAYWITERFSEMLFDKDVDREDIEIEKGALQVEIGEWTWSNKIFDQPLIKLKELSPPKHSIYETHFGLEKLKKLPRSYLDKVNNQNFTMNEVMAYYEKYYYPSNMTLKITGDFDKEKMKSVIKNSYGIIEKGGLYRTYKPSGKAKLSNNPFLYYVEGEKENRGYIGTQYIFDDCQKYIILNAFIKYVSTKIQQQLRNKYGKSYSVSSNNFQSRGAGVVSVSFDGLHKDFDNNIALVKESLQYYVENMDEKMIEEALNEYKKRYTSVSRLMSVVNQAEHLRINHNIENKTDYDFFKIITPEKFKEVLLETFIPQNRYMVIYREYTFFSGEGKLVTLLIVVVTLFFYFNYSRFIFSFRALKYRRREVLLSHRLSSRFIGFLTLVFLILITIYLYAWIEYLTMKNLVGDVNYLYTLDAPYGLYVDVVSSLLSTALMFLLFRYLFYYHSRIDITEYKLYILGSKPITIFKKDIYNIEVVPWSFDKFFSTLGFSFLFWKPMVQIDTSSETYYIRSANAEEFRRDLIERTQ